MVDDVFAHLLYELGVECVALLWNGFGGVSVGEDVIPRCVA